MPASDYFYYIDTTGYCSNGDFVLATGWKEDYSKVCAWKPSLLNVVYGCDGDNGIAWTSPSACDNSPSTGNVSMANGLQSCVRPSGSRWCCRDGTERCSLKPSEPFLCFNNDLDDQPMGKFPIELGKIAASASSILSSLSLTISTPSASQMTKTASIAIPASNTVTALKTPPHGRSSLSAGAIAGVSIGVLVMLGVIIVGAIYVLRRRKQRQEGLKAPSTQSGDSPPGPQAMKSPVKELSNTSALHELPGLTQTEMPPQNGSRSEQRWELLS